MPERKSRTPKTTLSPPAKTETKEITVSTLLGGLGWLLSWVFGILFSIIGLSFILMNTSGGWLILLLTFPIIPLGNNLLKKIAGLSLSSGMRILLGLAVFVTFVVGVSSYQSEQNPILSQESTKAPPELSHSQIINSAKNISYDELMRNNEQYVGDIVHMNGEILQALYDGTDNARLHQTFRISMKGSNEAIFVNYIGPRLLEGDIVEIYGKVEGLKSYKAVLGNTITVPEIEAKVILLKKKAGEK